MSIEICENYIKDSETLREIFNTNKKKDDLSDACLQAVAYIRNNLKNESLDNYDILY